MPEEKMIECNFSIHQGKVGTVYWYTYIETKSTVLPRDVLYHRPLVIRKIFEGRSEV